MIVPRPKLVLVVAFVLTSNVVLVAGEKSLVDSLLFHASFDGGFDADFARGDKSAYTADTYAREKISKGPKVPGLKLIPNAGRYGSALKFTIKTKETLLYKATGNIPYSSTGFGGTISFWLSLDPEKDLEPGFVDPIQITDKKWNDAAVWVDFTKDDKPRHFRLGVFSNFSAWNPDNIKWELFPADKKPLVEVAKPPFLSGKWTHVVITLSGLNKADDSASSGLYLDGKLQGTIAGLSKLNWDLEQTAIMLGIGYTGLFDDLAIFDEPLGPEEVVELHELKDGVSGLHSDR